MKYNIPCLGGRLCRSRNGTGLSQEKVATHLGISWMTVHRWERSQRNVPDHLLDRLCDLYDRPLMWFLTLEHGDLEDGVGEAKKAPIRPQSAAAESLSRKMADAPESHRPMIEKVVEDLLDALKSS